MMGTDHRPFEVPSHSRGSHANLTRVSQISERGPFGLGPRSHPEIQRQMLTSPVHTPPVQEESCVELAVYDVHERCDSIP